MPLDIAGAGVSFATAVTPPYEQTKVTRMLRTSRMLNELFLNRDIIYLLLSCFFRADFAKYPSFIFYTTNMDKVNIIKCI